MPGRTQGPDSWFYKARLAAGYPNGALLAAQLGVPKITVYQWEHGSAAATPTHRPSWRVMPQIAGALSVPLPELVEALWREKAGDPCPCPCGGTKVFPQGLPEARKLAIEIPCAKCGTKRTHKRWKKGRHRKYCPTCATVVKRIEFQCVGYRDHNATRHADTCPGSIKLRPSDVNARQRLKDNGLNSRFNISLKKYQCNGCAGAERLHRWDEAMLMRIWKEKHPSEKIKLRTQDQRLRLQRALYDERSPKFKPTREAQELGRRNFAAAGEAGKTWPKKTKENLKRGWSGGSSGEDLPKGIRLGICILCNKLSSQKIPRILGFTSSAMINGSPLQRVGCFSRAGFKEGGAPTLA